MRSSEQLPHGLSGQGALVDPDFLRAALHPLRHGHSAGMHRPGWGDLSALLAVCLCDVLLFSTQWLR